MLGIIRYDATNMFAKAVGKRGMPEAEFDSMRSRLDAAKAQVISDWKSKKQGWLGLPDEAGTIDQIKKIVAKQKGVDTCLVIGIGGSDLGSRTVWQALGQAKKGMKLEFMGASTDPDEVADVVARVPWKRTVVNVISKSGDTLEPMASFLLAREALIKAVGKTNFAKRIVATTSEKHGRLHKLATAEGYFTIPVPENVGGRFSVLSSVGLLPLVCAGAEVGQLLEGARLEREAFIKQAGSAYAGAVFGLLQHQADVVRGQGIQVLMPYSSRLREFGHWYRQLWAESLGKRVGLEKEKDIFVGPTPVAAMGPADQHSQMQLYTEGPWDKTVTFLEVGSFNHPVRVPTSAKDIGVFSYLSHMPFSAIIHAQRRASAEALRAAGRPSGTIRIERVEARTLGALFVFFEIATACAGHLYGVNPYDQPGVEAGKKATAALLGDPTMADQRADLASASRDGRVW